jgi:ParB/RepB/Spo0J family partition protein
MNLLEAYERCQTCGHMTAGGGCNRNLEEGADSPPLITQIESCDLRPGKDAISMAVETEEKYYARNEQPTEVRARLSELYPNPWNPRKTYDPEKLQEMAESIQQHDLLQPIVVREFAERRIQVINGTQDGKQGAFVVDILRHSESLHPYLSFHPTNEEAEAAAPKYEIIAGERRFRAAKLAEVESVPVRILHNIDDIKAKELCVIENLQRDDLNPIEKARGFNTLLDSGMTQEQIAQRCGCKQPTIAQLVGLLDLPEEAQKGIAEGQMTPSHGRALKSWMKYPKMYEGLLRRAMDGATTREIESGQFVELYGKAYKYLPYSHNWYQRKDIYGQCEGCQDRKENRCFNVDCQKVKEKQAKADDKVKEQAEAQQRREKMGFSDDVQVIKKKQEWQHWDGAERTYGDLTDTHIEAMGCRGCEHLCLAEIAYHGIHKVCVNMECYRERRKEFERAQEYEKRIPINGNMLGAWLKFGDTGANSRLAVVAMSDILTTRGRARHIKAAAALLDLDVDLSYLDLTGWDIPENAERQYFEELSKLDINQLVALAGLSRLFERFASDNDTLLSKTYFEVPVELPEPETVDAGASLEHPCVDCGGDCGDCTQIIVNDDNVLECVACGNTAESQDLIQHDDDCPNHPDNQLVMPAEETVSFDEVKAAAEDAGIISKDVSLASSIPDDEAPAADVLYPISGMVRKGDWICKRLEREPKESTANFDARIAATKRIVEADIEPGADHVQTDCGLTPISILDREYRFWLDKDTVKVGDELAFAPGGELNAIHTVSKLNKTEIRFYDSDSHPTYGTLNHGCYLVVSKARDKAVEK